jgi:hypothetical protein
MNGDCPMLQANGQSGPCCMAYTQYDQNIRTLSFQSRMMVDLESLRSSHTNDRVGH